MAKLPSDNSGKRHQTLSPAQRARDQEAKITLTESARRYAAHADILSDLEDMSMPGTCLTGDIVSLVNAGEAHDFAIIRRRWILSGSGDELEVTLDHPPRQAPR